MAKFKSKILVFFVVALVLVFAAVSFWFYSASFGRPTESERTGDFKDLPITRIELADTQEKRARGLMYRDDLCEGCGMLFVFDQPDNLSFWMRNTRISLDIIFVDEAGEVINVAENTTPFQESPSYTSLRSAKYVLEFEAGFSRKVGLSVGDKLNMRELIAQSVEFEYVEAKGSTN